MSRHAAWAGSLAALLALSAAAAGTAPLPRPPAAVQVCADPRLLGRQLARIVDEGGCGIAEPIEVISAAGVVLDPPPTLSCDAARALVIWIERGVRPNVAFRGVRIEALTVVDAYSCRNRNRAADGELSQHAVGGAIDIAGFRLSGSSVTVADGWPSPEWGPTLRRIHSAACGPFTTVLGPRANALHADHLHLDVEERRSGPYCE
jgi:hypothetical protein